MTEEEREAMSSDDELSRMLEAELDGTEGDHSKLNSEMAIPPERYIFIWSLSSLRW